MDDFRIALRKAHDAAKFLDRREPCLEQGSREAVRDQWFVGSEFNCAPERRDGQLAALLFAMDQPFDMPQPRITGCDLERAVDLVEREGRSRRVERRDCLIEHTRRV